jgi:hypothetical protein
MRPNWHLHNSENITIALINNVHSANLSVGLAVFIFGLIFVYPLLDKKNTALHADFTPYRQLPFGADELDI